ncbi:MAG: DNA polymerase sliding clamp [Desulfurococcaceae archaeon]
MMLVVLLTFRAVLPSGAKLKSIGAALSKLTDEVPFKATSNGLSIRVMSPDKTVLLDVLLPPQSFQEYEVDEEVSFVVSTSDLNRVLRRGTRNDLLVFELEKDKSVLRVGLRNKKTGVERSFYVELKPRVPEEVPELDIELGVTFRISTSDLKLLFKDVKSVGEEVMFHYKAGKLYVSAQEQQYRYEGVFEEGFPLKALEAVVEEAQSRYSVDTLALILRASGASKDVSISFDTDKPLKAVYEMEGGGTITYYVAPRAS